MKARDFPAALGTAIRERRVALGMSQEAFADHVGLHRTYIGSVERGERNLAVVNLAKIAHGLELKVSELVAAAETVRTGTRGSTK